MLQQAALTAEDFHIYARNLERTGDAAWHMAEAGHLECIGNIANLPIFANGGPRIAQLVTNLINNAHASGRELDLEAPIRY